MATTNESLGMSARPRMRLSGPPQLLQMVPYLVGFTPEQSVVLIGKKAPRGAVIVSARYDIDCPCGGRERSGSLPPGRLVRTASWR